MATYESMVLELRKKYNTGNSGGTASASGGSANTGNTTTGDSGSSSGGYASMVQQLREKYSQSVVDTDYINSFLSESQSFIQSAQEKYNSLTWENGRENNWGVDSLDYQDRSTRIRAYLDSRLNTLDADTTDSLRSYLDAFDQDVLAFSSVFDQASKIFSRYESGEAYERAEYFQKNARDVQTVTQELNSVNAQLTALYGEQNSQNLNNALSAAISNFYASSSGFATPVERAPTPSGVAELEQKKKLLEEELGWAQYFAQEQANANDAAWTEKYAGKSYNQLQRTLNLMTKGTDEYEWLSQYAPTVMTAEDKQQKINQNANEIYLLEAVLEEYNRSVDLSSEAGILAAAAKEKQLQTQYGSRKDILSRIEKLKLENWKLGNEIEYSYLSQNEDFADKSGYVSTKDTDGKAWWQHKTDYGDLTYEYINNQGAARDDISKFITSTESNENALLTYRKYENMTADEVAAYNYLYASKGKQAAEAYLEYLSYALNERQREKEKQNAADMSQGFWGGTASSVLSVPLNLMSGVGLLDAGLQKLSKNLQEAVTGEYAGPVDYNTDAMSASVAASTIRNTVSGNIAKATGTIKLSEQQHPYLARILNGKSLGDAYQLGMSMLDSMAVAALSPVIGSAGTALLGGSAGTQGMLDAVANGATDEQALTMGILNGAFEMLFEKYELESLLKSDSRMLRSIAFQALNEGVGETGTSLANLMADTIVMAEKSNWQQGINSYMESGLSEAEARKQAFWDVAIQTAWDFIGGALMGGIMGGGTSAIAKHQESRAEKIDSQTTGNSNADTLDPSVTADTVPAPLTQESQERVEVGETAQDEALPMDIQSQIERSMRWPGEETQAVTQENTYDPERDSIQAQVERNLGIRQTDTVTADGNGGVSLENVDITAPVSVAEQIRQQRAAAQQTEGGVNNVQTTEGADTAQPVTDAGGGVLYGSSQRNDGTRSGEQTGELAGSAEQAAQRKADASRRFAGVQYRQNLAKSLRLPRVSTSSLGITNGTDNPAVYVLPQENWDTELQNTASRIAQETGKQVLFVVGRLQVKGGKARGATVGEHIFVQADDIRYTPDQIADHEAFHVKRDLAYDHYHINIVRQLREKLAETYTPAQMKKILYKYVDAMEGYLDPRKATSQEESDAIMEQIMEELLADAYAGINAFGAGATEFTDEVNRYMTDHGMGKEQSQENGTAQTTGPPEARLSFAPETEEKEILSFSDEIQRQVEENWGIRPKQSDSTTAKDAYVDKSASGGYDFTKSFEEQLKDYEEGKFPQKDTFLLGKTPDILTKIGLAQLPMTMDREHVSYALEGNYKGSSERVKDHLMDKEELAGIVDLISDPVAIIQDKQLWQKNAREYSVDVLIEKTINGKKALVPININSIGWINGERIDSNRVQTVHGNEDTIQRLVNAINEDSDDNVALFYINKEKAADFLRHAGNPISRAAQELDGFIHSVTDPGSNVKMRIHSVTESRQFKEWFGDWQNHPEDASKVVNADGTPKVVYHGTNKNFTVFQSEDGCYWFSENEDYAESMAEERGSKIVMKAYLNMRRPYRTKLAPGQFSDPGYEAPIIRAAQAGNYDGVIIEVDTNNELEMDTFYVVFDPTQIKSATDNIGTFDGGNQDIRYSWAGDDAQQEAAAQKSEPKVKVPNRYELEKERQQWLREEENKRPKKKIKEIEATRSKKKFRSNMLGLFEIPQGRRAWYGGIIDGFADRILRKGEVTQADRENLFDQLYEGGAVITPADAIFAEGRSYLTSGKIYVNESLRSSLGDKWNELRKRAFAAGVYLTTDPAHAGVDTWNENLARQIPGLFDENETDMELALERIVQVAEEGRDERISLAEYVARLAEQEYISEDEILNTFERQMDWLIRSFAEEADLEIKLIQRADRMVANEKEKGRQRLNQEYLKQAQKETRLREERKKKAQRAKEAKELRELQQKTLKQLQWLSRNRNKAPEDLKKAWDEALGDIDLFAVGAANEMNWSDKYNATWKDLAKMYKDAKETDPNFMPSKDLEKIISRLDDSKIADMDLGALQDLYKAALGLRQEFYNRNNVINDETHRLFAEVYADTKQEIEAAPGRDTGKVLDKLFNLQQLTPMNVLQRMVGWNPDSTFYSMAKQLEQGERDVRAYKVKAQRILEGFLLEHEDWVKKADGQGKDGIWYEIEVPELTKLGMGDKPIFGDTVTVYMTPLMKVHMYLESRNYDNLRHMAGGRTFADKDLYSKGKRGDAFAHGTTVKLAPETVKKLVSDLTAEEMELARVLDHYYNTFAKDEINKVSNPLLGYDKAMGGTYAPIYTNQNYTKTEFGVFDDSAEGVGNLKERVQGSKNPSYNISAFDAFERHVDQTARYCGMAIPTRNWTTLMNWMGASSSTGDVIEHKWGKEGKAYIEDLITTLQGGDSTQHDIISDAALKAMSNYISAVFGVNPSIVLKQLGSVPMATPYLGLRNLPNPAQVSRIDTDLIAKYTQELAWRSMGYSMPETKMLKDNPNWTQSNKAVRFVFGGGAITAMDSWAASVLWPWAENKVRMENPDLEMGTQAQIDAGQSPFYQKVAEVFNDAVARSQSVSDEMHQSTLRKSKNPITRAFTLFRSDSAQTYNAIRQKIGEAQYYKRTGATKKAQHAAQRAIGQAFCAMLLNAVWSESVSFLNALVKNMGKRYRDDDDELTFQSVFEAMGVNMLTSLAGTVVGGEEIADLLGAILMGEKWYGVDELSMGTLNEVMNAVYDTGSGMRELITGAVDILKNGGDLGDYFDKHSGEMLGILKDVAETAATYLGGIPAGNIEAYLLGAFKWISPKFATAYEDAFSSIDKSDLSGMEGDALAVRISGILDDRKVSEEDETAQALADLYQAGYTKAVPSDTPDSVTVDGEEHKLTAYQQQMYEAVWGSIVGQYLDEVTASAEFAEADEAVREKMLKTLYDYAADQAKYSLYEAAGPASRADDIKAAMDAGLTMAEYLEAYSQYAELNGSDNNAGGNATAFAYWVDQQGYTESQADLLKDCFAYYSQVPADAAKYEKLIDSGLDPEDAYELAGDLTGLEDVEKWRACVDLSTMKDIQLAALCGTMSDSQFQKVKIAYDFDVSPDQYVSFYEIKDQFNEDGEGTLKNAEVTAAIDSLGGSYTTEQKAVLWQLATGSTSAKNNPYSRSVGQEVIDAREAAKEKAEEE